MRWCGMDGPSRMANGAPCCAPRPAGGAAWISWLVVSRLGLVWACSVWLKLGAGARKFQGGVVTPLTADFFKVYQNRGNREVRDAAGTDRGCFAWGGSTRRVTPRAVPTGTAWQLATVASLVLVAGPLTAGALSVAVPPFRAVVCGGVRLVAAVSVTPYTLPHPLPLCHSGWSAASTWTLTATTSSPARSRWARRSPSRCRGGRARLRSPTCCCLCATRRARRVAAARRTGSGRSAWPRRPARERAAAGGGRGSGAARGRAGARARASGWICGCNGRARVCVGRGVGGVAGGSSWAARTAHCAVGRGR